MHEDLNVPLVPSDVPDRVSEVQTLQPFYYYPGQPAHLWMEVQLSSRRRVLEALLWRFLLRDRPLISRRQYEENNMAYEPSRGGVRGGRDQFDWEDVKVDKDRENYLGKG